VLTSLEIKNFRTFSHLFIERLGRVNLILGKNNVGKTTLLEALQLYCSIWPPSSVRQMLNRRNEVTRLPDGESRVLLRSLFFGRNPKEGDTITIGDFGAEAGVFRATADFELESSDAETSNDSRLGRDALRLESPGLISRLFDDGNWTYMASAGWNMPKPPHEPPCLRAVEVQKDLENTLAAWWDVLSFKDAKSRVLDALRPIARVRDVAFVGDPRSGAGRMAKVRIDEFDEPVPLVTLGDGVVRVFELAVALEYAVYVRSGAEGQYRTNVFPVLLTDEVDVGIHHTLHADLWRFIFDAARRLDVQVFATTHSWDCLKGFAEAVAEDEEADGIAVRLERDEDEVATRAIVIDREKLPIIARDAIEVR
jgi:hypothetical protein